MSFSSHRRDRDHESFTSAIQKLLDLQQESKEQSPPPSSIWSLAKSINFIENTLADCERNERDHKRKQDLWVERTSSEMERHESLKDHENQHKRDRYQWGLKTKIEYSKKSLDQVGFWFF